MPLSKVDNPPKGAEQQARAAKVTKDVDSMQTQPPITLQHQEGNKFTNNFPYNAIPRDPYDDTYAMKARNTEVNPYTGAGKGGKDGTETVMRITKEDVEYQKRKAQVANNLRYQTWLINNIDMTNPKQGKLTRSYPHGLNLGRKRATIRKPTRALNASVAKQNRRWARSAALKSKPGSRGT